MNTTQINYDKSQFFHSVGTVINTPFSNSKIIVNNTCSLYTFVVITSSGILHVFDRLRNTFIPCINNENIFIAPNSSNFFTFTYQGNSNINDIKNMTDDIKLSMTKESYDVLIKLWNQQPNLFYNLHVS